MATYTAAWRSKREQTTGRSASYKHYLRKHYGITEAEYDAKRKAQGYKCALCAMHEDDIAPAKARFPGRLCVDHDHHTGTVRDLLCVRCNTFLGIAHDDPEMHERAIRYLKKHAPQTEPPHKLALLSRDITRRLVDEEAA